MDQHAKAKKTGKARIPDHLRRRALVSCDRCKKRRIRCNRSSGSDQNEPCQSCLEVGVQCESTLPRKTRIYGSVETLSVRYRVLDALIKGLYPQKDTNSIDTLYAIAEAHDIAIPIFDEQTVAEEVFNQPPKQQAATSPQHSTGSGGSPSIASRDSENPDGKPGKVVEEKLVPMPQGPSHYIGPSSSFGFVLTVRNMVAEFNAALRTIQPDDERAKISSDFAASNWSKALEPIVKEESEDSSEDNIDRSLGEPAGRIPIRKQRAPSLFPPSVDSNALSNRLKRVTVLSLLPGRDVTDTFVEAYFDKVHPNYLMFHRPRFQMRYEAMWSQPHVLMRDIEPGWICCIFMILVFGAQALEERDARQSIQIQRHYLSLVQARMHSLISATTLINVQAILLLQLYQHNCTERNSAFMLLGCASRMAMALGMHREGTSGGFDDMEREVRKRVWWTAYMFEQNQCAILGRPCAIDDSEVNVSYPDEVILDGGSSVPPGYIEYSVRLMRLLSDIRRKIYAAQTGSTQQGDSPKINIAVQFLLDLDSWHHSLPPALRLELMSPIPKHRRAVILLHVQFHNTQSLVTRPFILRKVGVQLARKLGKHVRSQDLDKEELNLSHACGTYSRKAALLLHQLIVSGMFDGVQWMDAYYIYHSVFILALDFLARPWDEQDTPEDHARKQAVRDVMVALQKVKLCPTFTILTQVSLQLAKIVGIFDTQPPQHDPTSEFRPGQFMQQQQQPGTAPIHFDYGAQTTHGGPQGNALQSWFQKGPVDLPWDLKDFFGTDTYVGPGQISPDHQTYHGMHAQQLPLTGASLGEGYNNHLNEVVGDGEDLIAPVPPHTAYTHWGQIDTPFAQHRGSLSKPSLNSMGQPHQ
ncbi:related to transcription factor, SIN3 binding [Phialocephala subalpina]|uniref:Related to transcription factor, SIN3 binding n=1 Tax=Phialocephala subalpina TaxID=576137 RepID=A0A1L7WEX1_9HELO|nr:related to transcription factor, SIN3 binding [Phialocephala subalpina]